MISLKFRFYNYELYVYGIVFMISIETAFESLQVLIINSGSTAGIPKHNGVIRI